ncbi:MULTISPECIES: SDR family NAD(P)-dependent oxidoreductase [Paenibacillus]|uniref:SDR family NAD(P)-dependent oxidoreductase n=1 Tax=Paenibacillus TaxID=44249 RepID=UPI00211F29ED|nr:SDR family NAD(P)-dependent oxidoreductase [Paenibacillus sp. LK1]
MGASDNLLVVQLDVNNPLDAKTAVKTTIEKFGRVDVLVNNAANFCAGFFEELSPAQVERQISTNLFGPMNVSRAVLPVMRKVRSGHIISISSLAGLVGQDFCGAYSATKFGLE